MPFVIGALIGLGIGFAGAILLAPEKSPNRKPLWGERPPKPGEGPASDNGQGTVRSTLDAIRQHVDEAMAEAKEASGEAEKEMRERFERMADRPTEPPTK